MPRRVLVLLPQTPFDPASGAARSVLYAARLLAQQGFSVRMLSPTASQSGKQVMHMLLLANFGMRPKIDRRAAVGRGCPVQSGDWEGVGCTFMDTGPLAVSAVDFTHGAQFSRMLEQELERFRPEVVITFGGTPADQARRELCRAKGAVVVLALHSLGYLHPLAFEHADAVWAPSEYVRRRYAEALGVESTVLPPVIDPVETIPPRWTPHAVTFVNPTPGKGVYVFVRMVEELARLRPGMVFRVYESRGAVEHFIQAGLNGGFDVRRIPTLELVSLQPRARDVLVGASVLVMPSVGEEAFGRLGAEAVMAGVPVIASDRGALPEVLGDSARLLAIPEGLTLASQQPISAEAAQPWVKAVLDTLEVLPGESGPAGGGGVGGIAARERARAWTPAALKDRYAAFFSSVRPAARPLVVPA